MKLAWDHKDRKERTNGYDRRRSDAPYHSSRWTKVAKAWKVEHPLCEACKSKGIIKAAEVVDHIVPHKGNAEMFYDRANLQPLCKMCHDAKTAKEDGGFGR